MATASRLRDFLAVATITAPMVATGTAAGMSTPSSTAATHVACAKPREPSNTARRGGECHRLAIQIATASAGATSATCHQAVAVTINTTAPTIITVPTMIQVVMVRIRVSGRASAVVVRPAVVMRPLAAFRWRVAGAYAPFLRAEPPRTSDAVSCHRSDATTLLASGEFGDADP